MNGIARLAAAFVRCSDEGRAALIPFLAAGDPDMETTRRVASAACAAGADILEIGLPFSDPLADGPVIQGAYTRALEGGSTTAAAFECVNGIAREREAPVVVMASLNLLIARGVTSFFEEAADAGTSAVLVPDLLVDDAGIVNDAARAAGIATVFMVAPDSSPGRVAAAAVASTGFVYLVRRRGVTGGGVADVNLDERIRTVRQASDVPVVVGFGVESAADVSRVAAVADGVIVGSRLVELSAASGSDAPLAVGMAVAELAAATRREGAPA